MKLSTMKPLAGSAPIWGGKKVEFRDWTMKPRTSCFPLFFLLLKCNLRALGKKLTLHLSNKAPFLLTNPVSDLANPSCLNFIANGIDDRAIMTRRLDWCVK